MFLGVHDLVVGYGFAFYLRCFWFWFVCFDLRVCCVMMFCYLLVYSLSSMCCLVCFRFVPSALFGLLDFSVTCC